MMFIMAARLALRPAELQRVLVKMHGIGAQVDLIPLEHMRDVVASDGHAKYLQNG